MTYKHTQPGYLMIVIDIVLAVYLIFLMKQAVETIAIIIISVVILILASFTTLTVTVDHQYLRLKFGYGIFSKKFPIKDITSAKAAKNKWYYGWGIKYVFWKPMWVFNVSGLDAVEIKLTNNKIYRIGTDEPKKLESELNRVIK